MSARDISGADQADNVVLSKTVDGTYYSLAIGIDNYSSWPKLRTASRGAADLTALLKLEYGFKEARIKRLIDREATRPAIVNNLRAIIKKAQPEDSLVIYFAGHGHKDELGVGSWIPVEAEKNDASGWISNVDVKEIIKGARARHVLLISDSCFAGMMLLRESDLKVEISDAFVQMAHGKQSRQALTSGGIEPVADGGADGHSVFTYFLLREMKENKREYLLPQDLYVRIRGGVAANAHQQPQFGPIYDTTGELGGEFVFFRQGDVGVLEKAIEQRRSECLELEVREERMQQVAKLQQIEWQNKTAELQAVEERIREIRQRMEHGQGAEGDTLDELCALVEQREREAAELEQMQMEAEKLRKAREEELTRLQVMEKARKKQEFEADRQKFVKIQDSKHADESLKKRAWEAICHKWGMNPENGKTEKSEPGFEYAHTILAKQFEELQLVALSRQWPEANKPWENSLGMKFVPVPGTELLFSIWETRVQDYEQFIKANPNFDTGKKLDYWDGKQWGKRAGNWRQLGFKQGPSHPVAGVSWRDAQAFCQWVSEKDRKEGRLGSDQVYRLPTDEEWSLAVGLPKEKGSTPKDRDAKIKKRYLWGSQWPPPKGAGNYADITLQRKYTGWTIIEGYEDGYAETSSVGSFTANRQGLYDMGGNVWEWCQDWYDKEQKHRVLRGASWHNGDPDYLLSSFRGYLTPGSRDNDSGFRCVLTLGGRGAGGIP